MTYPEHSKKDDFEFYLENIQDLLKDTEYLMNIPNFLPNSNHFYCRADNQGWWMVTKQIVFKHYINEYLTILGKRELIDLYFIDLLSNFGMNKVTKSEGLDEFIFPGSSVSAALISCIHTNGFKTIYSNDLDFNVRKVVYERLSQIKKINNDKCDIGVDISDQKQKIDSNNWVINVLNEIKNKSSNSNYLMIIDNQGYDIKFQTIKKLREISHYGDLIITFQNDMIKRNLKLYPQQIEEFFGISIPVNTKKDELSNIYIKQLKSHANIERVEKLKIASKSGYSYTLLFCCRKGIEAKWLNMIEFYRKRRFKSWNDSDVKKMWDVATGKVKPLTEF